MTEQPSNPSRWNQDSILIKLGFIIALVLLLLIPSAWIQSLIDDRQGYQEQNANDVASKWDSITRRMGKPSQVVQWRFLKSNYPEGIRDRLV